MKIQAVPNNIPEEHSTPIINSKLLKQQTDDESYFMMSSEKRKHRIEKKKLDLITQGNFVLKLNQVTELRRVYVSVLPKV